MRIKVTLKDPGTLRNAIAEALAEATFPSLNEAEAARVRELRSDQVHRFASRWFRHGEYLTVELDTEAETCLVVPIRAA